MQNDFLNTFSEISSEHAAGEQGEIPSVRDRASDEQPSTATTASPSLRENLSIARPAYYRRRPPAISSTDYKHTIKCVGYPESVYWLQDLVDYKTASPSLPVYWSKTKDPRRRTTTQGVFVCDHAGRVINKLSEMDFVRIPRESSLITGPALPCKKTSCRVWGETRAWSSLTHGVAKSWV